MTIVNALRWAAMAMMMAGATPACATDWYYVDQASDNTSVTYIDKDSIKANTDGYLTATMFSVLSELDEGALAYRFTIMADCTAHRTMLTGGEAFDGSRVSQGYNTIPGEWQAVDAGSQGETITQFICSHGKTSQASQGAALPFDAAAKKLAEPAAAK